MSVALVAPMLAKNIRYGDDIPGIIREKKDIQHVQRYRYEETPSQAVAHTHLVRAHLEFSNDFDSGFTVLPCIVLGSVDIAESAVTHLLQQSPSL